MIRSKRHLRIARRRVADAAQSEVNQNRQDACVTFVTQSEVNLSRQVSCATLEYAYVTLPSVLGTLLNTSTIIVGSLIGIAFGRAFSEKTSRTILAALGAGTLVYGVSMGMKTTNMLVPIIGLAIGTAIGCFLKLDERIEALAERLHKQVNCRSGRTKADLTDNNRESTASDLGHKPSDGSGLQSESVSIDDKSPKERFVEGFTTASVLYCVGPMTVLGSIEDGLGVSYKILALKALLDGIASIAFASALGVGVAFSALSVLIVQGAITLAAGFASPIFTDALVTELTACGGYILVLIGLGLIGASRVKTINTLPALLLTPIIVLILDALSINWQF